MGRLKRFLKKFIDWYYDFGLVMLVLSIIYMTVKLYFLLDIIEWLYCLMASTIALITIIQHIYYDRLKKGDRCQNTNLKKLLKDKENGKISDVDAEFITRGLAFCFNCGVRITTKNYGGVVKYNEKDVFLCDKCYNDRCFKWMS